jgi:hypothetical protein
MASDGGHWMRRRLVLCIAAGVLLFLAVSYPMLDTGQSTYFSPPHFAPLPFHAPPRSEQGAGDMHGMDTIQTQDTPDNSPTSSGEKAAREMATNRTQHSADIRADSSPTSSDTDTRSIATSSSSGFESEAGKDNGSVNVDSDLADTSTLTEANISRLLERMDQTLANMSFVSDLTFPEGFKLDFLPSYKSPCFREKKKIWCLPYFLIGGFPKCGTTELFAKLTQHPLIRKGQKKEPHWWTRYRYSKPERDFDFYKYFFKKSLRGVINTVDASGFHPAILTEGSASTVWDNHHLFSDPLVLPPHLNIHAIHAVLPDVKFVLIVRNPVTRLYSDYLYFQRTYSPEKFHEQVVSAVEFFNACVRDPRVPFLSCIYAPPPSRDNPLYDRLRIALYAVHLKVLLSVYPRENVFILQLENYMQDEISWLQKAMEFLGVQPMPAPDIAKVIQQRKAANANKSGYTKAGPMLNETRILLEQFYKPFNTQLKAFIGEGYFEY